LVFGKVDGVDVVCMQGRFHLYEGYKADACAFPIRVMKLFGVERLILTNAAGGLNPNYKLGDFMVLKDHLNMPALCGLSPIVGTNDTFWGPRFPNMHNCYDAELRKIGLEGNLKV
jgi:purine-nucleoside phosphorylase